jgi:hypothetical protein
MDLNEIRNRLNSIQTKNSPKTERKNVFWRPEVGKQTVRVVPNAFNKSNPFTEAFFYYGIGPKVMISPTNFGEKDPIAEFAKQLRQTSDSDNWRLAKKLDAKMRVFAPVIVRGQEDEGVKLWQFGKEMYMDFLNLADNEDVGDFTDVVSGRDITITTVGPEVTGTSYNKSSIMPKVKETPLSVNGDEVQDWLDNQPNPLEIFKRHSFDEMKEHLQNWLSPEDEAGEGDIIDDEKDEVASPAPQNNYTIKTPAAKVNNAAKFDSLFDDDSNSDDLPF